MYGRISFGCVSLFILGVASGTAYAQELAPAEQLGKMLFFDANLSTPPGLELFEREDKGNCAACHPSQPGANGEPPLFADFTYDNLGVPKNPENPFYDARRKWSPAGAAWIDLGPRRMDRPEYLNAKRILGESILEIAPKSNAAIEPRHIRAR